MLIYLFFLTLLPLHACHNSGQQTSPPVSYTKINEESMTIMGSGQPLQRTQYTESKSEWQKPD